MEHERIPAWFVTQELNDSFSDHPGSEKGFVLFETVDDLVYLFEEEGAFEAWCHKLGEFFVFHLEFVQGQSVQLDEMLKCVIKGIDGNGLLNCKFDFLIFQPIYDLLDLQDQLVIALLQLQIKLEAPYFLEIQVDRIVL